MASPQQIVAPAWSVRLTADLSASDQTARSLIAGLSEAQLNWQPAPNSWSIGQCLEHLALTNEAYVPPIGSALERRPHSPIDDIDPGWFGSWFLRNIVEPSPKTKRVKAPSKIQPASNVTAKVLDRFLSSNQSVRGAMQQAHAHNVNRIRFANPFVPGIRFRVGAGFEIIAAHERRHLQQAARVRQSPNFPH